MWLEQYISLWVGRVVLLVVAYFLFIACADAVIPDTHKVYRFWRIGFNCVWHYCYTSEITETYEDGTWVRLRPLFWRFMWITKKRRSS